MTKLFFAGVALVIAVVIASYTGIFAPLLGGVAQNLGGSPMVPFHAPVPQPWVDTLDRTVGRTTAGALMNGALAVVALLFLSTVATLVRQIVRRGQAGRRRQAELLQQARITAARQRSSDA